MDHLLMVQDAAVRLLTRSEWVTSLSSFHWHPNEFVIDFKVLGLTYRDVRLRIFLTCSIHLLPVDQ